MTNEEAKYVLKNATFLATANEFSEIEEAINMAVKALDGTIWGKSYGGVVPFGNAIFVGVDDVSEIKYAIVYDGVHIKSLYERSSDGKDN